MVRSCRRRGAKNMQNHCSISIPSFTRKIIAAPALQKNDARYQSAQANTSYVFSKKTGTNMAILGCITNSILWIPTAMVDPKLEYHSRNTRTAEHAQVVFFHRHGRNGQRRSTDFSVTNENIYRKRVLWQSQKKYDKVTR